jgi:hypothetical protein
LEQQIRQCTSDEQLWLIEKLASGLRQHAPCTQPQRLTEEEWHRSLVAAGLLARMPSQREPTPLRWDFHAIQIGGEPVSETIIRERR